MNKKAFFFSATAVFIIMALAFAFSISNTGTLTEKAKIESINSRVFILNEQITNLEDNFLPNALAYSSRNAMKAAGEFTISNKIFISNASANLSNIIRNGKMGELILMPQSYSITAKLNEFQSDIAGISDANFQITLNDVTVSQIDPWNILVSMNVTYILKDPIAEWDKTTVISRKVPIYGMVDPTYFVNSGGSLSNDFKKIFADKNSDDLVIFSSWDRPTFIEFVKSGAYAKNTEGMSYLSRLEGKFTPSACCGLQSFINPDTPGFVADPALNFVDYKYFSGVRGEIGVNGLNPFNISLKEQNDYKTNFGS